MIQAIAMNLLTKLGIVVGAGAGVAGLTALVFPKIVAVGIEIAAGMLDVVGCIYLLAFMLGWRTGGERVAVIWPLSLVLEVVAFGMWDL